MELSAPSCHSVFASLTSQGIAARAAASAAAGCATCAMPSASTKRAPSSSRAHSTHRIPMLHLARDQPGRRRGAIEYEVGAEILGHLLRHAIGRGATPSMMALASRVSGILAGSMTSRWASHSSASACASCSRRRGKSSARGRAHRPAIEQHRKPAGLLRTLAVSIEPLPQLRLHGAPRRRGRITRLALERYRRTDRAWIDRRAYQPAQPKGQLSIKVQWLRAISNIYCHGNIAAATVTMLHRNQGTQQENAVVTLQRWNFGPRAAKLPPGFGVTSRTTKTGRDLPAQAICIGATGVRARGVNEKYRHCCARLLPQGRGLPVGVPGAHARPRIHPVDRRRPLQRRLHDQLEVQRVSGDSRAHLRPPLRAGLPARDGSRRSRWRSAA